jgi:histidinol-phosphate aminotransferase
MVLNHGTYCSPRCAEVFAQRGERTSLRSYPLADNGDLKRALAQDAGVRPENILVANGSGPIIKSVIPFLIEQKIRRSPVRLARFLARRVAYPIITTDLTYSKVPAGAMRTGLRCVLLPLDPGQGFTLSLDALEAKLRERDGLVYLCNPNNPTGNVLITRAQLIPLLARYPESIFFVDEAYVHYLTDDEHARVSDLVTRFPNLVVLRSFSFAYGLASVRVGYAACDAAVVAQFEAKHTPHLVGQLATDLVLASLQDPTHLAFVQAETARERARLLEGLSGLPHVEVFPSKTNFLLCRARGPWTGKRVHDELLARGVKVKIFEPIGELRHDEYWRVTVGVPAENTLFLEQCRALFGSRPATNQAATV